jgi:2-alkyl-3-oxoalkanoate reductase
VTSFLHVDDAAAAGCLAVEAGRPGVYNIADDEPAAAAAWIPQVAAQLHAPSPRWLSDEDGLARYGWRAVHQRTAQRGADNRAARHDLGFAPSYPTWRHHLGLD